MKKSLEPTKHKKGLTPWRVPVLQNKPVSFRPSNKTKNFLKELDAADQNLSKHIDQALRLLETYRKEPKELMKELKKKFPLDFKHVNRNNFY